MDKLKAALTRIKDSALDFNDAHGKLTACIVAFVAGFALAKVF